MGGNNTRFSHGKVTNCTRNCSKVEEVRVSGGNGGGGFLQGSMGHGLYYIITSSQWKKYKVSYTYNCLDKCINNIQQGARF